MVIRFVTPSNMTTPLVMMPAAMISPSVSISVRATVAMLFMGCTHIGTLNRNPVVMFSRPVYVCEYVYVHARAYICIPYVLIWIYVR